MNKFFKSFTYAANGLKVSLWQRNMKVMVFCAIVAVAVGFTLHICLLDWCIILLCIGVALAFEVMNTAIELLVDLVEPELHPMAGRIKDLSAGAVLLFSVISAIIGILIFGKYILALLSLH
ncbi:MAG: diacylglycerol kinase family protein [Bacteroidota bacterium]|jgi:diacylglycerol kinase|nr:diacylglycerol kinase family protein [Bacteroidota bacterium]